MATHIKEVLQGFLNKKKKEIGEREELEKIIEETLDQKLKKHTHFRRIYRDNLIFYSDASGYSFDFYLKKEKLLKAIKKKFPHIKDIKIKTK